jgi:hypothetical protein
LARRPITPQDHAERKRSAAATVRGGIAQAIEN